MVLGKSGDGISIKDYHMRQIKYIKNEKSNYFNTLNTKDIYNLTDEQLTKISSGMSIEQVLGKPNHPSKDINKPPYK
jgi:hypothetical protein